MKLRHSVVACCALVLGQGAAGHDLDPSRDPSPLFLLQAPKDGLAYFRLRQKALALVAAENWVEAEQAVDELVRQYPRDPDNWRLVARTKRRLGKFQEGAAAARRASPILDQQGPYIEALNYLQAGDRTRALEALRRGIFQNGGVIRRFLVDDFPEFAALRGDPEFRRLTGDIDTSEWSRTQGWQNDLGFFYDEVKRVNPVYRDKPFPAEFERLYAQLRRNVPKLSDEQLFMGMQRMLASLQQSHMMLWADDRARVPNRWLPLQFYAFPDGLYVVDADEHHRSLIGSKLISVGNLSAEEALRQVARAIRSEGDMAAVWGAARLSETYNLLGMGAVHSPIQVSLKLQSRNGGVKAVTLATQSKPFKDRLDKLPAPRGCPAPLSLQTTDKMFWHVPLAHKAVLYVQVNNLLDTEEETLAAYGDRLWRDIQMTKPRFLVLDLRYNNGGTTQLYPSLLRSLIAFSRGDGNRLIVLIGRRTYSAAANLVTDLDRLLDPLFVGEATGQFGNFFGDPTPVVLPYSRIRGELTAMKWSLTSPTDERRELSPDIPVQLTAAAYFAGRDPVMEVVEHLIQGQ